MVEKSFKPDVFTCNILLRGLCREGMIEKALKLFNTWISKGKSVDTVTYNTVITSLCKEGRLDEAFDLVAKMEENKLGPDHFTYNAILSALTHAGRIEEATKFMSKMIETGNLLDQFLQMNKGEDKVASETLEETDSSSIAYSEHIDKLCTEGRYKDAMHVFEELTEKGIAVHKSAYMPLIKGLIKRRKSISKKARRE